MLTIQITYSSLPKEYFMKPKGCIALLVYLLLDEKKNKWTFSNYTDSIIFEEFDIWFKSIRLSDIRVPRGVMVIVVGNAHSDSSSNPGWDWLYFL